MADNLDMQKIISWCQRYEVLLRVVYEDDELRSFFQEYNAYQPMTRHIGVKKLLSKCMSDAYEAGVVINDYAKVIEEVNMSIDNIKTPSDEWVSTLSDKEILACIAWHFRRDRFAEGSYISEAVGKGYLLMFIKELLKR